MSISSNALQPKQNTSKKCRLRIPKEMKDTMTGAARTTVDLLSVVAAMTQSVPYLGMISTALTEFMKIQDEVDECKDECKTAMGTASWLISLIMRFHERCIAAGTEDSMLAESLRAPFAEIEDIVLESVTILQKCKVDSKRNRDRIRLFLNRSGLLKSVRACSEKMGTAVERLSYLLQLDQLVLLEDLRVAVGNISAGMVQSKGESSSSSTFVAARLPAPPPVFYGRSAEVQHAIDLIVQHPPARIALLGSGGIGKTSIALVILHSAEVKELYKTQRFFVSCETATTANDVARAVAQTFGLLLKDDAGPVQGQVLAHMETLNGIVCLDNLETPWEADTASVENLLVEIASLQGIALMVTSRVTDLPVIMWSTPRLPIIEPLEFEQAIATWTAICPVSDRYSRKLVHAVDGVPLAVTLLARLAKTDSPKDVWERWTTEHTEVVNSRRHVHRLNNLAVSIELSLRALNDQNAVHMLSIISMFPKGLLRSHFNSWKLAFNDHLSVPRTLTILKQHSLIQSEAYIPGGAETTLRVLSPIRLHMRHHHSVPDHLFRCLTDIYCDIEGRRVPRHFNNALTYLEIGLTRPGFSENCLRVIAHCSKDYCHIFYPPDLLIQAAKLARVYESPTERALCIRLSMMWKHRGEYGKAVSSILRAIELDKQAKFTIDEAEDWEEFAWIHLDAACVEAMPSASENHRHELDLVQDALKRVYGLSKCANRDAAQIQMVLDALTGLPKLQPLPRRNEHHRRVAHSYAFVQLVVPAAHKLTSRARASLDEKRVALHSRRIRRRSNSCHEYSSKTYELGNDRVGRAHES